MGNRHRDASYLMGIVFYFGMAFIATVPEIAKILKVTPRTIYGFLKRNDGDAIRVNRRASEDGGTLPSEYVVNPNFIRVTLEDNAEN